MSSLYENKAVREQADRLVQHEVNLCVSSLVYEVAQDPENRGPALGLDMDEVFSLCSRLETAYVFEDGEEFDDEDDAEEYAEDNARRLCSLCDEEWADGPKTEDGEEDRLHSCDEDEVSETYLSPLDFTEEERHVEAYEHWAVSNFLAEKLEAKGCIVQDTNIGQVWGRATTGQAIAMDAVILEIAKDIIDDVERLRSA